MIRSIDMIDKDTYDRYNHGDEQVNKFPQIRMLFSSHRSGKNMDK